MRWTRLTPIAVAFVAAASLSAARADLDVALGNGDRVTATLSPGDETETFRVVLPRDARVSVVVKGVRAKGAASAPQVSFGFVGPGAETLGADVTVVKGTGARLTRFPVATSGEHRIVVRGDGTAGDYTLSVSWTSRTVWKFGGTLAGAETTHSFSADPRATGSFTVRSGRGAALPRLSELRDGEGGALRAFDPPSKPASKVHAARSVPLDGGGEYLLAVTDAGTGGDFSGSVSVKPPRPSKRVLRLTSREVPAITGDAQVAFVGPEGGRFAVSEIDEIAGAALEIPAGAMGRAVAFVVGTAPAIDAGDATLDVGGPAVFFGPEGTTFPPGLEARVTIPFSAAAFPGGTSGLRVFTRDAAGAVSEITPVTIDAVANTVSFAASHFSSFQAFRPSAPAQLQRLVAAGGQAGDRLGFSAGLSGPLFVAGATNATPVETANAGAIHVFLETGGVFAEETALGASDGGAAERFGECVAIDGDTVVAGAYEHSHGVAQSGSAYVFVRDAGQWTEQAELRASDPVASGFFGYSVAISGDTIAVGALQAKNGASQTFGAVYVFVRSAGVWTQQQKILPADAVQFGGAGAAVALQGDTLALSKTTFTTGGAVWIYTRTGATWTFAQKLQADTPTARDAFGEYSIALDGGTLVAGVPRTFQPSAPLPEAYVFTRDGGGVWSKQAILQSGVANSFGEPVAISGDVVLVGAPSGGGTVASSGVVYRSRRTGTTWSAPLRFEAATPVFGEGFGSALAMDGTRYVIGAVAASSLRGAMYVFGTGD